MTYLCKNKKCGGRIRINWPFGKKSTRVESGHIDNCEGAK